MGFWMNEKSQPGRLTLTSKRRETIHLVFKQIHYSQKALNGKILNVFKEFSSTPSLHLFDPKYSKNSNILKYFYYLK